MCSAADAGTCAARVGGAVPRVCGRAVRQQRNERTLASMRSLHFSYASKGFVQEDSHFKSSAILGSGFSSSSTSLGTNEPPYLPNGEQG